MTQAEPSGGPPEAPRHYAPSHLFFLSGLRIKGGAIPVTLETWPDGVVYAHLYDALLSGQGNDAAEALADLREAIEREHRHLVAVQRTHKLGPPALRTWRALSALIEEQPHDAGEAAE
jgi:hypothetical protein